MRLSARNQIKGKIIGVQKGQTTGHVRIDIGNGVIITSSVLRLRPLTTAQADEIGPYLPLGGERVRSLRRSGAGQRW
jgi:molybdopterin-binding protein